MDKKAAWDFYVEHGPEIPRGILHTERTKMDWRRDALIANLIDKTFDSIKMVYRNAYDVSRLVVYPGQVHRREYWR